MRPHSTTPGHSETESLRTKWVGGNTDETTLVTGQLLQMPQRLWIRRPWFPDNTISLDYTRVVNSFATPSELITIKIKELITIKRIWASLRPIKTKLLPPSQKNPKLHPTVFFSKGKLWQVSLGVGLGDRRWGTVAQGFKTLERKRQAHQERKRKTHKGRRGAGGQDVEHHGRKEKTFGGFG